MTYSEQLERETESCRRQLADTLDELRARMTPGEVVDQLVDYAKDTTGGLFFQNLKQQVAVCRQSISDSWLGNLRECLAHLV